MAHTYPDSKELYGRRTKWKTVLAVASLDRKCEIIRVESVEKTGAQLSHAGETIGNRVLERKNRRRFWTLSPTVSVELGTGHRQLPTVSTVNKKQYSVHRRVPNQRLSTIKKALKDSE